jgi:hypothetical protein
VSLRVLRTASGPSASRIHFRITLQPQPLRLI